MQTNIDTCFFIIGIFEFENFGTYMQLDWKKTTQIKSWIKMDTTRKSIQAVAVFVKPTCKFKWAACKHPATDIPLDTIPSHQLRSPMYWPIVQIQWCCILIATNCLSIFLSIYLQLGKIVSIYGVHSTCMRYISYPCKVNPYKAAEVYTS